MDKNPRAGDNGSQCAAPAFVLFLLINKRLFPWRAWWNRPLYMPGLKSSSCPWSESWRRNGPGLRPRPALDTRRLKRTGIVNWSSTNLIWNLITTLRRIAYSNHVWAFYAEALSRRIETHHVREKCLLFETSVPNRNSSTVRFYKPFFVQIRLLQNRYM